MKWQTGKPKEKGKYLITKRGLIKGHGNCVDVAYWGKAYGHKQNVFYQTDSEWGDYILDDVLAWMPLPKPYEEESR